MADVPTCAPFLYMRYPVIATLSVDAVHVRLICEEETAVAVNPVGTVGTVVSVTAHNCESAGLFVVVPQALASVQVRVCVVLEQADHAVQIQDSTQAGVAAPPMVIG